jgi:hypothetical protein
MPPRDYVNSTNHWRERCIIRHIYCQSVGRAVRITLTGISTVGRPDPDPPPDRCPLPRRCDDSAGSWLASWNPALGIGGDSVLLATSTLSHFWGRWESRMTSLCSTPCGSMRQSIDEVCAKLLCRHCHKCCGGSRSNSAARRPRGPSKGWARDPARALRRPSSRADSARRSGFM